MFNKETEPCSAKAKCDFRSFRAVESFWTKQQSFISKKVGHQKWCLFFDFVCQFAPPPKGLRTQYAETILNRIANIFGKICMIKRNSCVSVSRFALAILPNFF